MATHSNILAWKIPWTEEPGGLESKGSQRVGHDWATKQAQARVSEVNQTSSLLGHTQGSVSCSVVSGFLQPSRREPARLLCPWNSPGKMLKWITIPFSKGSFWPRDQSQVSSIAGRFFTIWVTRETPGCTQSADTGGTRLKAAATQRQCTGRKVQSGCGSGSFLSWGLLNELGSY